jgi:site-specific DNA-methyltransferase (adenine-specific)
VEEENVSDLRPYWRSDDGAITVFHARCEDVIAAGLVQACDLVHADPPYGIDMQADRSKTRGGVPHPRRAFPKVVGDRDPFDPSPLLALDRPLVLWGANNYAARLPPSAAWIVWDKRVTMPADDGSDCEMAWTNIGASARMFRHVWKGLCRDSEHGDIHKHPTQKPIALSTYVFQRAKLKPGALVFVPYLGSGPDLPAARAMGLRVVACDVERWCCDTAIGRLGAITPERLADPIVEPPKPGEVRPQLSLFRSASRAPAR